MTAFPLAQHDLRAARAQVCNGGNTTAGNMSEIRLQLSAASKEPACREQLVIVREQLATVEDKLASMPPDGEGQQSQRAKSERDQLQSTVADLEQDLKHLRAAPPAATADANVAAGKGPPPAATGRKPRARRSSSSVLEARSSMRPPPLRALQLLKDEAADQDTDSHGSLDSPFFGDHPCEVFEPDPDAWAIRIPRPRSLPNLSDPSEHDETAPIDFVHVPGRRQYEGLPLEPNVTEKEHMEEQFRMYAMALAQILPRSFAATHNPCQLAQKRREEAGAVSPFERVS